MEFNFLPWERAIAVGAEDGFVGYYPAWPEDVVEGFSQSPVIFTSPVGFIEPKNKPLAWTSLADLTGKKIGIVNGYGNTKSFNDAVASGRLDGALIDLANAR